MAKAQNRTDGRVILHVPVHRPVREKVAKAANEAGVTMGRMVENVLARVADGEGLVAAYKRREIEKWTDTDTTTKKEIA